jgi:hypothetical protein
MPARLVQVVMGAADPARLARFWSAALGWPIVVEESDEVVVEPPEDDSAQQGQLPLIFVRVAEVKTTKNRVHLDLASRAVLGRRHGMGRARPGRPGRLAA